MPRAALELYRLTATELSGLLDKGEISPFEIVDALLARIDEVDGDVNAFVCIDAKLARNEARAVEREIVMGRRKGPLHGIPIAHKDVFDARGYGTTAGSRVTSWEQVESDSAIVAWLRAEGAIVLGKTNTTEFAAGTMEVFGETRNPWDLRMTTGTSSAGSAAAVSACMAPLATGSDTGGSIRIPAAYCGIVGFKPTFDAAAQTGMALFSHSFDTPGPMARCARDIALFMGVRTETFCSKLDGIRIGIPRNYFFENLDREAEHGVEAALDVLRERGVQFLEVDILHVAATAAAFWVIGYSDALATYRPQVLSRHADFTRPLLHRLLAAACLTDEELRRAQERRAAIAQGLESVLHDVDAIVTPTAPTSATPIGARLVHHDRNRFTRPANLAGIPALSMPCGFTSAGLPIGLQLMGRKKDEVALLRIASTYEEVTEWHSRMPPIAVAPVIAGVGARSAPESRDSDEVAPVLKCLHKQGFDFVDEELAANVAAVLEPIRSNG